MKKIGIQQALNELIDERREGLAAGRAAPDAGAGDASGEISIDIGHIRVGNEAYTKANKSFGATTLRKRHAKLTGGSSRSVDFARLFSRIAKKVAILKTKRDDINAIAESIHRAYLEAS